MLITVSDASKRWGVARTTIYRNIKSGKLSQSNGKIDHAEMVRVFGEPSADKKSRSEDAQLLQQLAESLQNRVDELERSIHATQQEKAALIQEKEWLRNQVDKAQETIKLLEPQSHGQVPATSRPQPKKGLIGRLIGAVLDD